MIYGWGWVYFVVGVMVQAAIATAIVTAGSGTAIVPSTFLGYLTFCTILWFIVLAIARAKGLDEARWLAWTFALGVVPLPFLIFARRYKAPPEATQTCSHCRSAIPEAATVCRYCTRDVQAASSPLQ
jgi:hypothetical protein